MKKAIGLIFVGILIGAVAFAAINTAIKTGEPRGYITFNYLDGSDYYPMHINLDMPTYTTNGRETGHEPLHFNLGTPQATPFAFETLADHQAVYNALPAWAQSAYKDLVIAAINEDPS